MAIKSGAVWPIPGRARGGEGVFVTGLAALILGVGLSAFELPDPGRELGAGLCLVGALICCLFLMARNSKGSGTRITAAERTYRAFFDHAIEGIFRTTPEGRYLDANPALASIYGYNDADELMSSLTDIADQLYVESTRREEFAALMSAHDSVTDFVSQIRRQDGSVIWISENARAVRDWTGKLVFYEGTVEDVTAKMETQNTLRRALREMEEASRSKSAFLAAMSHELKTPLNAVLGFAEILNTEMFGPLGNPVYRGYAADIHSSGSRLLGIVNDLLDTARIEGGALTLAKHEVTVFDLIEGGIALGQLRGRANCKIAIDVQPNLPEVEVDPQRLMQAIATLVANAIKFTPDDGQIVIRGRPIPNGGIRIDVSDTGIGMSPEKIAEAFQPFRQLDNTLARRFEGAGLGLSICKGLVDLHGGTLTIESAEGQGTTVSIELPPSRVKLRVLAATG
ncbi:MAG TPA: PAS domain-containing sensor histidine kinase [Rhizomicrobium sp.]|nr:PAS domain-containing sensor histidine kinase [Rhizomicrobium sp.]